MNPHFQQRRTFVARTLVGGMLSSMTWQVLAQQTKSMRIVVPFAAGGVQDILARSISTELAGALGQTMIVENRAGAGGTVGTAQVAKMDADGTAMVMAAASHNIAG